MRLVMITLLTGLSAALGLRWLFGGLRRPVGISLCLLLAAVLGWQEVRWYSQQDLFSTVAQDLSQRDDVTVDCQRLGGAMLDIGIYSGTVQFDANGRPADKTDLTWQTCRSLAAYARGDQTAPPLDQVEAVHVLAHEAEHLRGTHSEALTECISMQNVDRAAGLFGASAAEAQKLAVRYWREVYPNMREEYRSADCREDGPMDVTPEDGVWP